MREYNPFRGKKYDRTEEKEKHLETKWRKENQHQRETGKIR